MNKSTILHGVTIVLVIIGLVGAWMAYSAAGVKEEVPVGEEVTEAKVASFLSGKSWSDVQSILESAGIEVPTEGVGEGIFADQEIVYFAGAEGGAFSRRLTEGARAAERALGCEVRIMYSGWNPAIMVSNLSEAIGYNPDAICIMGHPGVDAYRAGVEEAYEKGIVVTSHNVPLPELERKYKLQGFGYVGQELHPSGYMLGDWLVKQYNLGPENTAFVWGLLAQAGRGKRTKGVMDAFSDAGVETVYQEISDEVNASPPAGAPVFAAIMERNPEIDVVVTDHGTMTSTISEYFEAAGLEPGEVLAAGFDLTSGSLHAMEEGSLTGVLDQQPWFQGYLSVYQACVSSKYNFAGLHIRTGTKIVTSEEASRIAEFVEQGIR